MNDVSPDMIRSECPKMEQGAGTAYVKTEHRIEVMGLIKIGDRKSKMVKGMDADNFNH